MFIMMPIRGGPLKGKRWIAASGIRFLRGEYEPAQTEAILEALRPGYVVYDIGAHHGYYTLLAAEVVGADGLVAAFEPRPVNLSYLHKHLRINGCANVEVFNVCVSDRSGTCRLDTRYGTGRGRISPDGELVVEMVCLDDLIRNGRLPPPNLVKIDVEGAEKLVLAGARETISRYLPIVVISTHGEKLHEQCTEALAAQGYRLRTLNAGEIFAEPEWCIPDSPCTLP